MPEAEAPAAQNRERRGALHEEREPTRRAMCHINGLSGKSLPGTHEMRSIQMLYLDEVSLAFAIRAFLTSTNMVI